jgi:hypothetical protein
MSPPSSGMKGKPARNQQEEGGNLETKRPLALTGLHHAIFQKTKVFMVTAVRTSNPKITTNYS